MKVTIICRHGHAPDEVKDYAAGKLEHLERFNRHTRSLECILDEDGLHKSVEIRAHLERGPPLIVHARHEDWRATVDIANDKVENALRRLKERLEDRRHRKGPSIEEHVPTPQSEDVTGEFEEI